MKKKNVAVIFGGKSGEHEVSICSAISVFNALDKSNYNVALIGIDKSGRWLMPSEAKVLAHANNPRLLKLNQETESFSLVPFESNRQLVGVEDRSAAPQIQTKIDVIMTRQDLAERFQRTEVGIQYYFQKFRRDDFRIPGLSKVDRKRIREITSR